MNSGGDPIVERCRILASLAAFSRHPEGGPFEAPTMDLFDSYHSLRTCLGGCEERP